eukprot:10240415-Alexandrium_andersonii.AAC.1
MSARAPTRRRGAPATSGRQRSKPPGRRETAFPHAKRGVGPKLKGLQSIGRTLAPGWECWASVAPATAAC